MAQAMYKIYLTKTTMAKKAQLKVKRPKGGLPNFKGNNPLGWITREENEIGIHYHGGKHHSLVMILEEEFQESIFGRFFFSVAKEI